MNDICKCDLNQGCTCGVMERERAGKRAEVEVIGSPVIGSKPGEEWEPVHECCDGQGHVMRRLSLESPAPARGMLAFDDGRANDSLAKRLGFYIGRALQRAFANGNGLRIVTHEIDDPPERRKERGIVDV